MSRFVVLAATFGLSGVALGADDRPNVAVILADDEGWGDLSLNGNTNLRTPHIDSLAKDGAQFDRFFVQPVCSPTRAEFLTGRWHPHGGVKRSAGAPNCSFFTNWTKPGDTMTWAVEVNRVPRGSESCVKDFRPLSLGVVDLPVGKGS